jgi:hypothetical protein
MQHIEPRELFWRRASRKLGTPVPMIPRCLRWVAGGRRIPRAVTMISETSSSADPQAVAGHVSGDPL